MRSDSIVEIQIEPDTVDGFAILDDNTEMEINKELIELVKHHFTGIRITKRFDFMRWLSRG